MNRIFFSPPCMLGCRLQVRTPTLQTSLHIYSVDKMGGKKVIPHLGALVHLL